VIGQHRGSQPSATCLSSCTARHAPSVCAASWLRRLSTHRSEGVVFSVPPPLRHMPYALCATGQRRFESRSTLRQLFSKFNSLDGCALRVHNRVHKMPSGILCAPLFPGGHPVAPASLPPRQRSGARCGSVEWRLPFARGGLPLGQRSARNSRRDDALAKRRCTLARRATPAGLLRQRRHLRPAGSM
jgi:hypothetical protein